MSIDFAAIAEAGRQLQEEKHRLTREVSELGAEKGRLERLVFSLEPENERLRAEKGRLERIIASLEPENAHLRTEVTARAAEIERLQRLLRDMREAVATIGGICQQMVSQTDVAPGAAEELKPVPSEPSPRVVESAGLEQARKKPLWKIGGGDEPDWIDRATPEELQEELVRCRKARQDTTAGRIEAKLAQLGVSIPAAA